MQTIQTIYSNGNIRAKSWNGWVRVEVNHALSSEQNHRAAAQKLVDKLNANRLVSWGITASAPGVPGLRGADGGWVFIIEHIPEVARCYMSITVRFLPSTNSQPARMRVHSWLNPKGRTVHYSAGVIGGDDIQGWARHAAGIELGHINASAKDHGDLIGYKLGDYIEAYNGDRIFSLK